MSPHVLVLFIGILWYPIGMPELYVVQSPTLAKCQTLEDTFDLAVKLQNAATLPAFRNAFSSHCEAVLYDEKKNA